MLSSNASPPQRGSSESAGYDLKSARNLVIPKNSTKLVFTDLILNIPVGCYGRVASRSGLSLKGINVNGGVIDRDYKGNIGIVLHNQSDFDFEVCVGDRIAQLICEKIEYPDLYEFKLSEIEQTERNCKGFGSSGMQ